MSLPPSFGSPLGKDGIWHGIEYAERYFVEINRR